MIDPQANRHQSPRSLSIRSGDQGQAQRLCRFVLLLPLLPKQLIKVSHALPLTHLTQRGFIAEVPQLWIVTLQVLHLGVTSLLLDPAVPIPMTTI
jgi:hypothetical protein